MVCSYGMSSLGTMALDESYTRYNSEIIRVEIKKIIDERYGEALRIITENKYLLHHIADILLSKETLTNEDIDKIFKLYEDNVSCATPSS